MMKLSSQNIQFIDTYLKNSEIDFFDIRVEMVDHIASDIEAEINNGDSREFYYIFKDYMIKNKAGLLKDNKKYYRSSDDKVIKSVFKNMVSTKGIIMFLALFFSLVILNKFLSEQTYITFLKFSPIMLFLFLGISYRFFIWKKAKRFSSVERIGIYFMIIGQIINLTMQSKIGKQIESPGELNRLQIFIFIMAFLVLILMQTAFQFKKYYETNYKSVH